MDAHRSYTTRMGTQRSLGWKHWVSICLPLLFLWAEAAPVRGAEIGNSDFIAAAPDTYDHEVGGGAYNDRTIGNDKDGVESLTGGSFACGELVHVEDHEPG